MATVRVIGLPLSVGPGSEALRRACFQTLQQELLRDDWAQGVRTSWIHVLVGSRHQTRLAEGAASVRTRMRDREVVCLGGSLPLAWVRGSRPAERATGRA